MAGEAGRGGSSCSCFFKHNKHCHFVAPTEAAAVSMQPLWSKRSQRGCFP